MSLPSSRSGKAFFFFFNDTVTSEIYSNEGLAQVLFFEADEECEISYADKKGKYQKQQSIVLPKL